MNNPTDTNQASEDEQALIDRIDDMQIEAKYNGYQYYLTTESVYRVRDLIRTEKLKLLDRLHHEYYEVDEDSLDTLIEAERNKLKEVEL